METLNKINLTPVRAKALSEVLQKYAAYRMESCKFSFRSCIEIVKLAALLYRLHREHGNFVWLSPWQLKISWLACYKLGVHPWFIREHYREVFRQFPELEYKYPLSNFNFKQNG